MLFCEGELQKLCLACIESSRCLRSYFLNQKKDNKTVAFDIIMVTTMTCFVLQSNCKITKV